MCSELQQLGDPDPSLSPNSNLQALPQRLMQADVLDTVTSQNIANTVWALATLGITNVDLLKAVAARAICPKYCLGICDTAHYKTKSDACTS